jgi:hypothetical protein
VRELDEKCEKNAARIAHRSTAISLEQKRTAFFGIAPVRNEVG